MIDWIAARTERSECAHPFLHALAVSRFVAELLGDEAE